MGTKTDSSLKARGARLQPTEQLPRGNYRNFKDTVLTGGLENFDPGGGSISSYDFTPGRLINLIAFCQDVPVYASARFIYFGVNSPSPMPFVEYNRSANLDAGLNGGNPGVIVPDPSLALPLGINQAVYGTTPTNSVTVTGYFLQTFNFDWGFQDDEAEDILPLCVLDVIAAGSVLEGNITQGNEVDASESFRPVWLWEQDYTQAMADAGNTFVTGDGFGGTLNVKVLGIFEEVSL
jgi:hypothetical protein